MKYTIKVGRKRGSWGESIVAGLLGSCVSVLILIALPILAIALFFFVFIAPILGLLGFVYIEWYG